MMLNLAILETQQQQGICLPHHQVKDLVAEGRFLLEIRHRLFDGTSILLPLSGCISH